VGGALVVVVVMRVVADHRVGLPSSARDAHADGHATSASGNKDDHGDRLLPKAAKELLILQTRLKDTATLVRPDL
jgi:hypothetical protein